MSYQDFIDNLEGKGQTVKTFEEDVEAWKNMSPKEKAAVIQEVKGDDEASKYVLEISESANVPNTEAGGSGDEAGKEIDPTTTAGEPKAATNMSDDDPQMSDKGKIAAAAGIAQGLGALNLAKKLRREQVAGVPASSPSGAAE